MKRSRCGRDSLVVPRQFLECLAAPVYRAVTVYHHVVHIVGIYQLYSLGLCAERKIVRFHGLIVCQVGTAIQRGTMFEMQVDIAFEHYRAYLVASRGHYYPSAAGPRAGVYGLLHCNGAQSRGIADGAEIHDVVVCGTSLRHGDT